MLPANRSINARRIVNEVVYVAGIRPGRNVFHESDCDLRAILRAIFLKGIQLRRNGNPLGQDWRMARCKCSALAEGVAAVPVHLAHFFLMYLCSVRLEASRLLLNKSGPAQCSST